MPDLKDYLEALLYEEGTITLDDALHASSNPHDLRLAMRKAGVA